MIAGQIILPRFLRGLLASCPPAGEGVHNWLFRTARYLHALFPDPEDIANLLEAASFNCGRRILRSEIEDAIRNSRAYAWVPGQAQSRCARIPAPWPSRDWQRIEAILRDAPGLYDLWENSPHRFEDDEPHADEIIAELFPGDPLLCCGLSESRFATKPRTHWNGSLSTRQFIVPSPMALEFGITRAGKKSAHCLDNTGERRFLGIECDFLAEDVSRFASAGIRDALDLCAAVVRELSQFAPLALVVHSAGKSLHAWFFCAEQREEELRKFMRYAVSLGADPRTWTKSQFLRMPDGYRPNCGRQTTYFFNPACTTAGVQL